MKSILIIDDDVETLRMHEMMFRGAPYRVETTRSGSEGIERCCAMAKAGTPFDLVVSDLVLTLDSDSGISGVKVIEKVRECSPSAKVVLCSGRSRLLDDTTVQRIGIDEIWEKPVKNFRGRVEKLLNVTPTQNSNGAKRIIGANLGINGMFVSIWCMLLILLSLGLFTLYRAPRLYSSLSSIDQKLTAATVNKLPPGYAVTVPNTKAAYQVMHDGRSRVTFEFEAKDAATAATIASKRGARFYFKVTDE